MIDDLVRLETAKGFLKRSSLISRLLTLPSLQTSRSHRKFNSLSTAERIRCVTRINDPFDQRLNKHLYAESDPMIAAWRRTIVNAGGIEDSIQPLLQRLDVENRRSSKVRKRGANAVSVDLASLITAHDNIRMRREHALLYLEENRLVSYERGGEQFAIAIAAYLPEAIKQVESIEGLTFAKTVKIRIFVDWRNYRNLSGDIRGLTAATVADRISFSPKVLTESECARGILTHELSHALLRQHMGSEYLSLPAWFDEGLAVLVSDGSGTDTVTEDDAFEAICQGEHFAPDEYTYSFGNFGSRTGAAFGLSEQMFNRQAELFVRYMQQYNPEGFRVSLSDLGNKTLATAVEHRYAATIAQLWQEFLSAQRC